MRFGRTALRARVCALVSILRLRGWGFGLRMRPCPSPGGFGVLCEGLLPLQALPSLGTSSQVVRHAGGGLPGGGRRLGWFRMGQQIIPTHLVGLARCHRRRRGGGQGCPLEGPLSWAGGEGQSPAPRPRPSDLPRLVPTSGAGAGFGCHSLCPSHLRGISVPGDTPSPGLVWVQGKRRRQTKGQETPWYWRCPGATDSWDSSALAWSSLAPGQDAPSWLCL